MREYLEKALTLGFFSLAARLPFCLRRLIAASLHPIIWLMNLDIRRTTEVNLRLCYPQLSDKEHQQLAKDSIYHTLLLALEIPVVWTQTAEKSLTQIVSVEGKALLDEAKKQGKGVIVIAPHLGNWEYLGLYLGQHYQATSLYSPPKKQWLEATTRKGREKTGASLQPANKKGVLAVLRALKQGGVTGILPDQLPGKDGGAAYVSFFGQVTPTMTLIPNLLRRGNIVAIAGFAKRLENDQFKIIFQPAPDAIYDADETIATTALNQSVEQLVALAPEQYQWEYKRFRRGDQREKRRIYH